MIYGVQGQSPGAWYKRQITPPHLTPNQTPSIVGYIISKVSISDVGGSTPP